MPDTVTANVVASVSRESLENLLGDGFEIGIGYWCRDVRNTGRGSSRLNHETHIARGGTVHIWSVDDTLDAPHNLTASRVIGAAIQWGTMTGRFCLSNDGDYDIDDADAIIQLAAFGEVIYG